MPRIRIRHHVNPLRLAFHHVTSERVPLPATGEVEVELGCADARFLFERAAQHPEVTCIGVEIREDLVVDVNQRAAERGLPNLRAVFANVNTDLDDLFADGRIDRLFLNFPDPWFKHRHHKRRVVTPEVVAAIHEKLAPSAIFFFQSDVEDLARAALSVIERSGLFINQHGAGAFCPANPWGARSLREIGCERRGMPVWRMSYRRREIAEMDPAARLSLERRRLLASLRARYLSASQRSGSETS